MRLAAMALVALVLIAGAAVILWSGNMVNSWVLGGLIGGLAALLLSIPISLTLFTYFSRRHDDRLRAEVEEEILAQVYDAQHGEAPVGVYEADDYPPLRGAVEGEGRRAQMNNLPAQSYPRLPAPGQGQAYRSGNLPMQRSPEYAPTRQQPAARGKDALANRGMYDPGNHTRSLRTQALRAARQEAAQEYRDEEMFPPTASRRTPPAVRPPQSLVKQNGRNSQQLPRNNNHYQPERTIDANPAQANPRRPLPASGESTASPTTQGLRQRDRQTEQFRNGQPQTGPVRQPQTGQIVRNPDLPSIKTPLVRRAPYMYEDDPIRQELAQQIDTPAVRRSSRYEAEPQEYDD